MCHIGYLQTGTFIFNAYLYVKKWKPVLLSLFESKYLKCEGENIYVCIYFFILVSNLNIKFPADIQILIDSKIILPMINFDAKWILSKGNNNKSLCGKLKNTNVNWKANKPNIVTF